MFLSHNFGVSLLVVALLLYSRVASVWVYLKKLDAIIKRGRVKTTTLRPGRPTEVGHLDQATLALATQELADMGFAFAGDFVSFSVEGGFHSAPVAPIASPQSSAPPPVLNLDTASFLRVMLHEQSGCIAKIMSVAVMDKAGAIRRNQFICALSSVSEAPTESELWTYATTNISPIGSESGLYALWRRPRALSTRVPRAPALDLWRLHLERREQIARAGNFRWKRVTLRDALEAETRANQNIRACFEGLTPLKMAWQLRLHKLQKKSNEWLGELTGKL